MTASGTLTWGLMTDIPKIKIDRSNTTLVMRCPFGDLYMKQPSINVEEANVVEEDFKAGSTVHFEFPYTEVHYILEGEAEVSYTLMSSFYTEKKTMKIEAGDAYLIPRGAFVEWKVSPKGPLRKFCVVMPGIAGVQQKLPPDKFQNLRDDLSYMAPAE